MNWLNSIKYISNKKFYVKNIVIGSDKYNLTILFVKFMMAIYIILYIVTYTDYFSFILLKNIYYSIDYNAVLLKVVLFSFWFNFGLYLNVKLIPKYPIIKEFLNKQNILILFIIVFLIMFTIKFIFGTIFSFFFRELIEISNISNLGLNNMVEQQTGNSSTSNSPAPNLGKAAESNLGKAADAGIMTAAITGAYKLAHKVPSSAGKFATVTAGLGIGALGILGKNISSNVSSNLGKETKKLLPDSDSLNELISNTFNFTGNNGLDLLILIQYFQKIELFLICIIIYHLLYLFIDETKLENFLVSKFPYCTKIILIYIKSIKALKKSILISLFVLFVLLLLSNYYSIYYLGFFIDNLEGIVEYYLKHK